MFNRTLADKIVDVLSDHFPEKVQFDVLAAALPEYQVVPEEEWLRALDALEQDGRIEFVPLRGPGRTLIGAANMAVTKAERSNRQSRVLQEEKKKDARLPLFDSSEFDRDLPKMISASTKESPGTLVVIDVDKFKTINDSLGHEVGNIALKAIADVLLRVGDKKGISAYRFGGDEFCLLLPNHSMDEGSAVAVRILREVQAIREAEIPNGLSISLGIACFPETTIDPEGLFKAADRAMYIAKEAGGNRVCPADMIEVSRLSEKPVSRTAELNRNSLAQDLERTVRQTLDQMTHTGHLLLRHLLMREPLELGRVFMREIPIERQNEQMAIAFDSGIVRHEEKRQGAMVWTYYVVNPQHKASLEKVLYEVLQ